MLNWFVQRFKRSTQTVNSIQNDITFKHMTKWDNKKYHYKIIKTSISMMMSLKYESIKSLKMDPEKKHQKKHCIFICNSIMNHYD